MTRTKILSENKIDLPDALQKKVSNHIIIGVYTESI